MKQLVFIHIPHTGGTTMRYILGKIYKLGWDQTEHENIFNMILHGANIQKFTNFDYSMYHCIIGHFPMSKYIYLKNSNWKFVTWIRDPVERMISFYTKRRNRGFLGGVPDFMEINIVEFSRRWSNSYEKYLDMNLELIDFVGFTETYDESLKKMGLKVNKYEKRNVGSKQKMRITKDQRNKMKEILHKDYAIYNMLYKRFS